MMDLDFLALFQTTLMTQMLWRELTGDALPATAGIQTSVKLWAGNWIPHAAEQLLSPHAVEAVLRNYRSLHKASREEKKKSLPTTKENSHAATKTQGSQNKKEKDGMFRQIG